MNANVIKSYLVSLGYDVDQATVNKFNEALRTSAETVASFTGGAARTFVELGAAAVTALTSIAAGTVALMESTAKADLGYQLFARRMFTSVEAAKQLKIATDALGMSLEDIIWGPPEVRERYQQLIQDQKAMQAGLGGAGFEGEMRKIRDVTFEFTRLKVEAQYFVMNLVKSLSKALTGDEDGLLQRLKSWNQWLIENIPRLADEMSSKLAPILRDVKAIWGDIANILGIVASEFIKLVGIFTSDASLKTGKVSIENIGRAMDYLASATRKVFDALNSVAEFFTGHSWLLKLMMPGYGGAAVGNWAKGAMGMGGDSAGAEAGSSAPMAPSTQGIRSMVTAAADKYGIPREIAMAVADKESGFNPTATGTKGDYGVMQLMPGTASALGVNRYDVGQNIEGGVRLLSDNMKRYGNWTQALEAYNGGGKGASTGFNRGYAEDVLDRANQIHVTVNVQTGANPHEIGETVARKVDDKMKEARLRSLVNAKAVGTYS